MKTYNPELKRDHHSHTGNVYDDYNVVMIPSECGHWCQASVAKELLEALQVMLPLAEKRARDFGADPAKDADFIKARAAIAKATGQK